MQWGGVCEIVSKFQWLWPPPLLTCKAHTPNSPHPTCTPPSSSSPLPAGGHYALLSLPFAWGASLGTVFTSAVASFTSGSVLAWSLFTAFPLRGRKQKGWKRRKEIPLEWTRLSSHSWTVCLLSGSSNGGKEVETCRMLWGNLFSLLELNAFHT